MPKWLERRAAYLSFHSLHRPPEGPCGSCRSEPRCRVAHFFQTGAPASSDLPRHRGSFQRLARRVDAQIAIGLVLVLPALVPINRRLDARHFCSSATKASLNHSALSPVPGNSPTPNSASMMGFVGSNSQISWYGSSEHVEQIRPRLVWKLFSVGAQREPVDVVRTRIILAQVVPAIRRLRKIIGVKNPEDVFRAAGAHAIHHVSITSLEFFGSLEGGRVGIWGSPLPRRRKCPTTETSCRSFPSPMPQKMAGRKRARHRPTGRCTRPISPRGLRRENSDPGPLFCS